MTEKEKEELTSLAAEITLWIGISLIVFAVVLFLNS